MTHPYNILFSTFSATASGIFLCSLKGAICPEVVAAITLVILATELGLRHSEFYFLLSCAKENNRETMTGVAFGCIFCLDFLLSSFVLLTLEGVEGQLYQVNLAQSVSWRQEDDCHMFSHKCSEDDAYENSGGEL